MLNATAKSLLGSRQIKCRPLQYIPALASPATARCASLSAIHRGLRRSERVRFGEPRSFKSRDSDQSIRTADDFERTFKALEGASSSRQQQKLRKKLDRKASAAEDEEGTGRQTRRKRFLDPEFSFGKRSLVYQLKHGSLKDTAASLKLQEPVRPRRWVSNDDEPRRNSHRDRQAVRTPWRDQVRHDQVRREQPWHDARSRHDQVRHDQVRHDQVRHDQVRHDQVRHDQVRHDQAQCDQPWNDDRARHDQVQRDQVRRDRVRHDRVRYDQPRHDQPWHDNRPRHDRVRHDNFQHDQQHEHDSGDSGADITNDAAARPKKRGMVPMIITYTTAASQFLYGKSVVKAALEQGRRQLYKLYVYGGENRRDSKDNDTMMALARSRGVPITIVPNEDQRLMDKMSMGRPHNGFVLETSPLPQLPVQSLGQLEETPSRLGFHIKLDHQTAEQRSINGQDTFVRKARSSTCKPLVLLLHEILDPGNLGALLRTASYMGIDAVGITSRGSANLTPVVLKSAAGAAEEVTIFTVNSPVEFLQESRAMGWKTYSAVAPPEKKLVRIHGDKFISTDDIEQDRPLDRHPCILVLGNEGHGLPRPIKVATEFEVSVPKFVQDSSVDSLNVSVAAGLLCHSFVKEGSATRPVIEAPALDSRSAVDSEKPSVVESDDAFF
ncbi:hypothetical protein E4U43_008026 [Claviceps pusilla]|uniref:rRNA methyltransferase 1, mitochondrial n=1 Tax=Claviceps pusilla TaxID=123648 RepID=A0A9P7NBT4_9HYPO|nr:hypothetical protein E4U43_008026 [Claviceps pusilla]